MESSITKVAGAIGIRINTEETWYIIFVILSVKLHVQQLYSFNFFFKFKKIVMKI